MRKLIPNVPETFSLLDLLKQCVCTDELREHLCKINYWNNAYHATDGNVLVSIPKELVPDINLVEVGEWAGIEKPIKKDHYTGTREVDRDFILQRLQSLPTEPLHEECSKCEGYGETECETCGHSEDCYVCKGTGDGEKIIGESYVYQHWVRIHGIVLSPILLEQAYLLAKILKAEVIEYDFGKPNEALRFRVSSATVFIVPVVIPEGRDQYESQITEFFLSEPVTA